MSKKPRLGAATCSVVVRCIEDEETFRCAKPQDRFNAWKGRDFWHKDISVQVRLEPNGTVFLSTQEGHVNTLQTKEITLDEFYQVIRALTQPNAKFSDAAKDGGKTP